MKRSKKKKYALRSMAAGTSAAVMMSSFGGFPMSITAFAEDTAIGDVTVYSEDDYDGAELLGSYIDHYVMEGLGYPSVSLFDVRNSGRESLSAEEKDVYDQVLAEIKKIADGERASTSISVSYDRQSEWGNMNDDVFSALINNVIYALLKDCPYELYWYDKTIGSAGKDGKLLGNTTFSFNFNFTPASEYKDSAELTVNTAKTTAAKNAAANITEIISKYEGKSDLEKLTGYKNEICSLVSYNEAATNSSTPYGNPWQLIWVFDKDDNTNVVCEGYSKAFKYLCDMTTFSEPIYCYLVSGTMNSGGHMWNIVDFGDATYHVDVTNCDNGTVGNPDKLFLKGVTKTENGFTATAGSSINTYVFRDADKTLYADEISRLSAEDYSAPAAIESISIAESSTHKKEYTFGDEFDPKGLVITVTYDGASTKNVAYSESNKDRFSFDITTFDSAGDSKEVTVTYGGKTAKITVKVNPFTLTESDVSLSETSFDYDGNAKTPTVTVKVNGSALTVNTDYTVSYSNNTNAGEATVTVTGKGNYSGTVNKTFTINKGTPTVTAPVANGITFGQSLSDSTLTDGWSWSANNASEIKPAVDNTGYEAYLQISVTDDKNYDYSKLSGYTYDSENRRLKKTVSVSVSAKVLAESDLEFVDGTITKEYDGTTSSTAKVRIKAGVVGAEAVIISGTAVYDSADVKSATKVTFTPDAISNANYSLSPSVTIEKPATITPKKITPDVEISGTYAYTGSEITPTYTVTYNTKPLVLDTDYSSVLANNTNAGSASLTVKQVENGNYTFTDVTKNFTINKKQINSVTIKDVDVPSAQTAFDTSATVSDEGISLETFEWKKGADVVSGTADFNTVYTAVITVTPDENHEFKTGVTATVNGNNGTFNTLSDGKIAVSYTFPATARGTLSASDFNFVAPENLEYDGNAKTATVTANVTGTGAVSVKYYNGDVVLTSKPVNAGTYGVKITVAEGERYSAVTEPIGSWSFTITKATPAAVTTPTVTGTLTYGDTLSSAALPAGWNWVNPDTVPAVGINGYSAEITVDDSNYDYSTVDGYNSTNHTITRAVSVTVNAKKVTAPTADSTTFTYNGSEQTYTLAESDYYTITGNKQTNAGTHAVTVALKNKTNTSWSDETTADKTYNFTINKAAATVTAKSYTIKEGDHLPASLEYDVSGLKGTDTIGGIGANVTIDYEGGTMPSGSGTYNIVVTGNSSTDNYTLTYKNGTLVISAKEVQTITASDVNLTYGETDKKITASTSSGNEVTYTVETGDDVIGVAADGTITVKKAGTATVKITAAETDNCAAATKTVTVTVNKKKVAVPAADSTEYTYNGKPQSYGIVSTSDYTVTGGTQTNSGEYPVTIALANENYEWDGTPGTYKFVIKKAPVTITAKDYTIKVGGTLPASYDYTVSGLVNNETLPITVNTSCLAANSNSTGTFQIQASGVATSDNYSYTYSNGTLTITAKTAQTITASDLTFTYGKTGTISASTNGNGALSYEVLTGSDVISVNAGGAVTALMAGTATVKITAAETDGFAEATKTINVTVNKAQVTIKANSYSVYVGDALPVYDFTVTGLAAGDSLSFTPALSCDAVDTSAENSYTITVIIGTTEDDKYTYTAQNGTLSVQKKSSGGTGGTGGGSSSGGSSSTTNNPIVDGKKQTWTDVAKDIEKLTDGKTQTINLNGGSTVPVEVVKAIATSDAEVTFKVNDTFSWTIDGSEIDPKNAKTANLSVTKTTVTGTSALRGNVGIGFKLNGTNVKSELNINFKTTNAGQFANLFKKVDGKLVFVDNVKVDKNGAAVGLEVSEKGEYVVMLGKYSDRAGDIDNDGFMNTKDSLAILRDSLGIEKGVNPLVADVNHDGYINSKDALQILIEFLTIR